MCKSLLACVLVIVGIAATVVCVITLAIPFWYTSDTGSVSVTTTVKVTTYEGLWQRCTLTEIDSDPVHCDHIWDTNGNTDAKKAVLAMCFLGLVGLICFVAILLLHMSLCSAFDFLPKVAACLVLLAGLFLLIAVIVYGTKVKDDVGFDATDFSAGFGMCLIVAIVCFVLGGLTFLIE